MNKSEQTAMPAQPEVYTRRKLNGLYREIPLKDTTFRQLRKYLSAMAKLYGIIPLRKVYDIIAEQSASLVSEQDFATFAEIARHECEGYRILGADELLGGKTDSIFERELIDSALLADGGVRYAQIKQMQADKPYYIPDKATLLCYQDENFYEPSEKVEALRDWIATHFAIEEQHAHDVFARIAYEIRRETRTPLDIMELLTEAQCTFTTKQQVEEFMQVFAAYCNHAPMQANRGYAPTTLPKLLGASKTPRGMYTGVTVRSAQKSSPALCYGLMEVVHAHSYPNAARQSVASERTRAQTVRRDKVGRNQPCPCGSGKKYKKCHGR